MKALKQVPTSARSISAEAGFSPPSESGSGITEARRRPANSGGGVAPNGLPRQSCSFGKNALCDGDRWLSPSSSSFASPGGGGVRRLSRDERLPRGSIPPVLCRLYPRTLRPRGAPAPPPPPLSEGLFDGESGDILQRASSGCSDSITSPSIVLRRSRTRCVCDRRWPVSGDGDRESGLWLLGEGLRPLRFAETLRAPRVIFRPGPPAADPGEPMSLSAAATSGRTMIQAPSARTYVNASKIQKEGSFSAGRASASGRCFYGRHN